MAPERVVARGPGRVNLVGEHTDYNAGLCLPFAIPLGVTVSAAALPGDRIEARALERAERDGFDLSDPGRPGAGGPEGWRAFLRGTVGELLEAGMPLCGARIEIEGDLPEGIGLSSSAALSTALALALIALAGVPEPDRRELARLCSRVENDWVGAQTGLLDQLAALLGQEGHALLLDCRDLSVQLVPLELGHWTLAVIDSGASHSHAQSGYNDRRRECAEACEALGVDSLRDATEAGARELPDPLDRRVRHVLEENGRVLGAARALRERDLSALGEILDASHASLRDLYEVSVPEVEATVQRARAAGARGARIMGGGFGGAVLALFEPGAELPDDALEVTAGPAARVVEADGARADPPVASRLGEKRRP